MTEEKKIELMMKVTKAFNPLVRWLLKSSLLHGIVSKDIALLHFQGRKSGRWFDTPVTYIETDGKISIVTEAPWWRNIRERPQIKLTLRGDEVSATATAESDDTDKIARTITALLSQAPRDAPFYGVRMEKRQPNLDDVAKAATRAIVIEATLNA
jgi:hypothetical protein